MYILGVHDYHCATAALLQNNSIVGAVSEERFTRRKNEAGFPFRAVAYCLKKAHINGNEVDRLVLSGTDTFPMISSIARIGSPLSPSPHLSWWHRSKKWYYAVREQVRNWQYRFPFMPDIDQTLTTASTQLVNRMVGRSYFRVIAQATGIAPSKIRVIDHHLAHSCAAVFSSPLALSKHPVLVFTCDGAGNNLSATVSLYHQKKLKRLVINPMNRSLGAFYSYITLSLGMKILEHEYKVMGLAPYAAESGQLTAYRILKPLIWLDRSTLTFRTKFSSELFGRYMRERLAGIRFDYIAGAAQQITEEILTAWIQEACRRYRVHTIVCGGGVFMNVKANQKILSLPEVKRAFFMPSAGDESNAIGAAYWGYHQLTGKIPRPLSHLYLGPSYGRSAIEQVLRKHRAHSRYHIRYIREIEPRIARLVARGQVVARFAGRMEWGARALGNRSILADASRVEIKETINRMIKSRDFWMPFAPVILAQDQSRYLINPKKMPAPYMIITFDSTPVARKHLAAAMHPYDKTLRPQVIDKAVNPSYHRILTEYKRLTGMSGLLNTSFNIHGEPIVCSPEDALSVLERSGLKYLALENYLIWKKT